MQIFLSKRQGGYPFAQLPKNYTFRLKRASYLESLAHQFIVEFSYAWGRAPPPSYLYIEHVKTKTEPEIKHFQVAKCKIFLGTADISTT